MAKLRNLEHIDGKLVKFSTVTSQNPQLFVQRKRNTGEMIISTDTDDIYGMHHIYLGGEHIAGGYGFPSSVIRDDLTYIQETYNSTFNYFNNAYTYLAQSYIGTRSYLLNSYQYLKTTISENSFLNTKTDEVYNSITDLYSNTTYNLSFNKGILNVKYNEPTYINISANLNPSFLINDISGNIKYDDINYSYVYNDLLIIKKGNNDITNASLNIYVTTDSVYNQLSLSTNLYNLLYGNIKLQNINKNTNLVIKNLPILREFNSNKVKTTINITYKVKNTITNKYSNETSNTIEIICNNPIIYGNLSTDMLSNINNLINNQDYTNAFLNLINKDNYNIFKKIYNTNQLSKIDNINITTEEKTYILFGIPNSLFSNVELTNKSYNIEFYVSNNIYEKSHIEGGFIYLTSLSDYTFFISEIQNISKTYNIDIIF